MAQKGRAKGNGKGKGPELLFDDKARAEYLTGFRKRKQERKQAGREYLAKKAKEEQLAARKELRQARKQKAAENVREQRKAFGLEAEGESDLDAAANSDEDGHDDDEAAVAQVQEQDYDSDEHHTHVVVESFDPELEAFEKATAAPSLAASTKKPKANGQSQETSDAHQEEDVTQKRLHISGLTASFSQEELIRRFSTFGTVVALDGLGKRDALGQFRPYAYLTLRAPSHQIKRCTTMLSGSVWKGATLRIGEARPDYQQRIQLEKEKWRQEQEDRENRPKRFKRLPPGVGVECSSMEPIEKETVESGLAWGWKVTPAGHLVRPLRMRPSHPLPRPSRASTLARMGANADEDVQGHERPSRRARINPRPPTKAHRITIDPTRYGAVHLSGPLLESLATETGSSTSVFDVTSLGAGQWKCEEIYDGEEAEEKMHRLVRWQYVAKDGKILHQEFTKLPVRIVPSILAEHAANHEDDVLAQLDFDRYSDASSNDDFFSGLASSINLTEAHNQSGKFSTTPAAAPIVENDVSDTADIDGLFDDLPATTVAATNVDDLFSDFPTVNTSTLRPKRLNVHNFPPTPEPSKKGTFVPGLDPDEEDPANFSDGYDEGAVAGPERDSKQVAGAKEERERTLALLGEMFGSGPMDDTSVNAVVEIDIDNEAGEKEKQSARDSTSASSTDWKGEAEAAEVESAQDNSEMTSSSDVESDVAEEGVADGEVAPELRDTVFAGRAAEAEAEDVSIADHPEPAAEPPSAPANAKSRRAAFLLSLSDPSISEAKQLGSYVPIARFDPGTSSSAAGDEPNPAPAGPQPYPSNPTDQASNSAQAAQGEAQETKVSISTLKEMFKPQDRTSNSGITAGFSLGLGASKDNEDADAGGGFSLMDSLGLEFELEEEEPEPEAMTPFTAASYSNIGYSRFQQPAAPQDQGKAQRQKPGLFFPSSSSSSSWNSGDNQGSVQRWLKSRSEEEKEKDWAKYKEGLTQVIKKRHREAARKHKRNFKSLPLQQHNQPGASVHGRV